MKFGKVFRSLWEGSMVGKRDMQLVFVFLLAHADAHGIVDVHPRVVSACTGIPEADVRAALDELEAPDPESRSPEHDGARIKRVDEHRTWGWLVLNAAKYREMADLDHQRRLTAARVREHRKRQTALPALPVTPGNDTQTQTQTQTQTEETTPTAPPRAKRASEPSNPFHVPEGFEAPDEARSWTFPFETIGAGEARFVVTGVDVAWLQKLYPTLNVEEELRKAWAWLATNGKKTAKGMPKFIVGWLNRACDGRRGNGARPAPGQGRKRADDAYREQNERGGN